MIAAASSSVKVAKILGFAVKLFWYVLATVSQASDTWSIVFRIVAPPVLVWVKSADVGDVPRKTEVPPPCALRTRFGRKVQKLRTREGLALTQEALAERCRFDICSTSSREFIGHHSPSLPLFGHIWRVHGMSFSTLVDRSESPPLDFSQRNR